MVHLKIGSITSFVKLNKQRRTSPSEERMITGESVSGNFADGGGTNHRGGDDHPTIATGTRNVESVLFNRHLFCLLAAFLDARDLCQLSLTCKILGGKQAAYDCLSLVEKAASWLFDCASDWEKSCLLRYDDEGWLHLHHNLLLLRSKLTFDQLLGSNIQYGENQSSVEPLNRRRVDSSALCSNHVMRSGRHFVEFTGLTGEGKFGVIRPVQINQSDFKDGELDTFSPGSEKLWGYMRNQRTGRWCDFDDRCCKVKRRVDWTVLRVSAIDCFRCGGCISLLLDLEKGTLSVHKNGRLLKGEEKQGLSGEYCWYAVVKNSSISIKRVPGD